MTSLQRKCTKQHDPKGKKKRKSRVSVELGSLLSKDVAMDRVRMASTHGAETKPDPNVNYAIFEQNESEERAGRGYQKA